LPPSVVLLNQQLPTAPETQNQTPKPKPKSLNLKKLQHLDSKVEEKELNFTSPSSSNLKLPTHKNQQIIRQMPATTS
jgi:hypothetical protein